MIISISPRFTEVIPFISNLAPNDTRPTCFLTGVSTEKGCGVAPAGAFGGSPAVKP